MYDELQSEKLTDCVRIRTRAPTEIWEWVRGADPAFDAWVEALSLALLLGSNLTFRFELPQESETDTHVTFWKVTFQWVKPATRTLSMCDLAWKVLKEYEPGAVLLLRGGVFKKLSQYGISIDCCGYCGSQNFFPATGESARMGWDCGTCGGN